MPPLARGFLASLVAAIALGLPVGTAASAPTRVEKMVVGVINEARAAHGLPRLRFGWSLHHRSRDHAARLIRANGFFHGRLSPRVRENLAYGTTRYLSARRIVRLWLASPPHRATLLWPGARRAGVGVVRGRYLGHGDMRVAVARLAR